MSFSTGASVRHQKPSSESPGFPLRYALALSVSVVLHAVIWQMRHRMDATPTLQAKPPATLEVIMVSPPKRVESAPLPPVSPPLPAPPVVPPTPPKNPPPLPKPKPQPPSKPRPQPVAIKPLPVAESPMAVPSAVDPVPAAPAPPAPAPVVREEPRPEPYTEARGDAAYLNNPKPDYPAMAKRRFLEGRVILKVQVLASGQPGQVMLDTSSGHTILDEAAMETVQQWRFVPAKRGDRAVDSWVKVPIVFKLNK